MLRSKYQHLKVLIIDQTFGHLDLALRAIMQNLYPFGVVSLLVLGDLSQLPLFNQKGMFMKSSKGSCWSFNGMLWETFQQHKLVGIVWQSNDSDFAQLLYRV